MEVVVPPGFRFHPTEEELVGYYLLRRIKSLKIDLDVIVDIDLYKMEPWDIQSRCSLGYEDQNEWYFFSHKDRKYPTGTRTNRATAAGFWKATGRDKAVMSKNTIIGMRKTLVFYKGRAPNGRKTDWIMHEYRHQTTEHGPPQEEGWVVCRAFKKPIPSQRPGFEAWNYNNINNNTNNYNYNYNYNNNGAYCSYDTISHRPSLYCNNPDSSNLDKFLESSSGNINIADHQLPELPQLESPSPIISTDWKSLDSLLALQGTDTAFFPFQNLPSNDYPQEGDDLGGGEYCGVAHFLGCSNSDS